MKRALSTLAVFLTGTFVLFGCKKDNNTTTKTRARAPQTRKAIVKKENVLDSTLAVKAYEVVRLALAADDLAAAKKGAAAFAGVVKAQASSSKSGSDKAAYVGMETAAKKLASTKDFASARLAFGDLSKHIISYLSGVPTRSKGLTAYQCPMAKGYKKWVQTDAKMANPYMGKKMLMCGGKTSFSP